MDWYAQQFFGFAYILRLIIARFLGRPIIEVVRGVSVTKRHR